MFPNSWVQTCERTLGALMLRFVWNETEVLTCLGVLPTEDEYGTQYLYQVDRCGIRLELAIEPYAGDISVTLHQIGMLIPLLTLNLIDCCGVRYINDERGQYLEFAPAEAFGSRYDGLSVIPYGVRVSVEPYISITLF